MTRLYAQIYLAFVGILLLFAVVASVAWMSVSRARDDAQIFDGVASIVGEVLPAPDRPQAELQEAIERLAEKFDAHLAIFDASGKPLAAVGEPLPAPDLDESRGGWMLGRGAGFTLSLHLPDGRWLVGRHVRRRQPVGGLAVLGSLALAIAVGAYPIVRGLTRRLERLKGRVEELGAGDLSARVEVEGNDEIAALARSFNDAAARIERLVAAQKGLLAAASHELRSPLARLRVAVELLADGKRPELMERVERDIKELDELIEEILLASRLDAIERPERAEDVDLLALVAEEGARVDAEVSGEPVTLRGDERLLRRMMRNLFENAHRHGAGAAIEASVTLRPDGAVLVRVEDEGPGVAEEDRERIFEPFYRSPATRASESRPGAGLGLALVRQIARHHGGEVSCRRREGGGSRFEVGFSRATPQIH